MTRRALCRAQTSKALFTHYAHGDPLPVYARFHGEQTDATKEEAIPVYIECARETLHPGDHLAIDGTRWTK